MTNQQRRDFHRQLKQAQMRCRAARAELNQALKALEELHTVSAEPTDAK